MPVELKNSSTLSAVVSEIERAMKKFPTWPTDPLHALAVLGEEFGELTKACVQHVYEPNKEQIADVRKEAVQTAAMAIRFLMSLDHYKFSPGEQHGQRLGCTACDRGDYTLGLAEWCPKGDPKYAR